ncbi:hypothetical protein IJJ12_00385, partial [bacterium]|nr:hypothetical protein [bacterium]
KSIYHAHVHQIFLANVDGLFDFMARELSNLGMCCQIATFRGSYLYELRDYLQPGEDYMYFRVDDKQIVAHDRNTGGLISQHFRVKLCEFYGVPFLNWKDASESVRATFAHRLTSSLPTRLPVYEEAHSK